MPPPPARRAPRAPAPWRTRVGRRRPALPRLPPGAAPQAGGRARPGRQRLRPGPAGGLPRLYVVDVTGATDVRGRRALPADLAGVTPASKTLLLDLASLGITLDNLEGLTFGPRLPDGRRSVVLVSDDDFSATQQTQFLFSAV